jgi:hypothetical protein
MELGISSPRHMAAFKLLRREETLEEAEGEMI